VDYSKLSRPERRQHRNDLKAATQINKHKKLVEAVAQFSSAEDEGDRRFTIGYQYYRDDICQVKHMDHSPLRKVLEGYKNMSRCITEVEIYNLPMDIKRITVRGNYTKYASKLTPDTEISEFDAGSHRGFFFIDRTLKIVQMIAVDHHPEDKKQKR
jgi:hypothetical protein